MRSINRKIVKGQAVFQIQAGNEGGGLINRICGVGKRYHRRDTEDAKVAQRKTLRPLCALCASAVNLMTSS
jgi:hypothetical protein